MSRQEQVSAHPIKLQNQAFKTLISAPAKKPQSGQQLCRALKQETIRVIGREHLLHLAARVPMVAMEPRAASQTPDHFGHVVKFLPDDNASDQNQMEESARFATIPEHQRVSADSKCQILSISFVMNYEEVVASALHFDPDSDSASILWITGGAVHGEGPSKRQ